MTAHVNASSPEFLNSGLLARLGMKIGDISAERVTGSMPIEGNTQPYGLLHGGASAALAETLGSLGAYAHAEPDGVAVGVDLNITHHRAVSTGFVHGTATSLKLGRTMASYNVEIIDDEGALVATARLSCIILPTPPGQVA